MAIKENSQKSPSRNNANIKKIVESSFIYVTLKEKEVRTRDKNHKLFASDNTTNIVSL